MNFSDRRQGSVVLVVKNFLILRVIFFFMILIIYVVCFESRTSTKIEFEEIFKLIFFKTSRPFGWNEILSH